MQYGAKLVTIKYFYEFGSFHESKYSFILLLFPLYLP